MAPAFYEKEGVQTEITEGSRASIEDGNSKITVLTLPSGNGFIGKVVFGEGSDISKPVIVCEKFPGPVRLGQGTLRYVKPQLASSNT